MDPNLEKLELSLSKPNIFNILRITNAEIRHSNFLAWILDPNGSHGLKDRFLKWFLKEVFGDRKIKWANEFIVDSIQTRKIEIYREFKGIDLLIKAKDFLVIIENKIYSQEHTNQLQRYVKVINKLFPNKNYAFIFLTPYGIEPDLEEDSNIYINYSYSSIARILEIILEIYSDSINNNVKTYLNDYLIILRRYIMKDDELVKIAQEIYRNHKEALDFIFENKPDKMLEVLPVFIEAIKEAGYVPESQNKGYSRFLTSKLHDVIPRTGLGGWKNNEAFLFEISYWSKNLSLKCVVSPGLEKNRELLIQALSKVKGYKKPKTKLWSTTHSRKTTINIYDDKYQDLDLLKKDLIGFLNGQKDFIEQIEKEILKVSNHFIKT